MRNVYTALRFGQRPDLHMTLRYWAQATDGQEHSIQESLASFVAHGPFYGVRPFMLILDRPQYLGFHQKVRVLCPTTPLPPWVPMYQEKGGFVGERPWIPHVTTEEPRLVLQVTGIALMHKKNVIEEFELPHPGEPRDLGVVP